MVRAGMGVFVGTDGCTGVQLRSWGTESRQGWQRMTIVGVAKDTIVKGKGPEIRSGEEGYEWSSESRELKQDMFKG